MNEIETLKKELEDTKLAYQMMAQISHFKSGFLAKTAHELRSPLSSLMGLHQLILADLCENPEEEREFIEQGYQAAHKLIEIIDSIVTISKLDYGKIPLKIETVSLNYILNQVHRLTKLQATNYSLKIELKISQTDIYIKADKSRFIQGLTALVDTAISLTKRGTITISTQLNQLESMVNILIDIPCSIKDWQEEKQGLELSQTNLDLVKQWSHNLEMSPAMKFLLSQTLLEKMGGQLILLDISPENQPDTITRVKCLIPWEEYQ
ncbi:HAMP domain-containing sensor histidine kinase [Crocosphaera sp. XPORK-15E]|uniref:sensor histidine kinase n=1 Tax=Crocosphaera sp. XPORK-15E TaxID=3110247 RepID=UPI002B20A0C2|nr:HAMP domain-containing sensor histidine kinase [Crocosphaera sp. XPORK-15E]MEA5533291.1 HAMP domain-containing sensor histidine kinase [Crocosphaera sp. XPORK-15E]